MAERNRGVSGSTVGLIIFVILFVFALAGAIFAWNKASGEESLKVARENELKALIGARDKSNPQYEKLQALPKQAGQTVVGALLEQYNIRDVKATVAEADLKKAGDEALGLKKSVDSLTADLKSANAKIAGMNDERNKMIAARSMVNSMPPPASSRPRKPNFRNSPGLWLVNTRSTTII